MYTYIGEWSEKMKTTHVTNSRGIIVHTDSWV